jgi:hypothetical protein
MVHVDELIEGAKDEMVAGNKELREAEDDQKGGSKLMLIILAVVAAVVFIVGTILGLKFGGII